MIDCVCFSWSCFLLFLLMVLFTLLIIVSECNVESKEERLRRKAKWERSFSAVFVCFMRFLSGDGFYWGRRNDICALWWRLSQLEITVGTFPYSDFHMRKFILNLEEIFFIFSFFPEISVFKYKNIIFHVPNN